MGHLCAKRLSLIVRAACCPQTKPYAVFFQLQSKMETCLITPTVIFFSQEPRHEGLRKKRKAEDFT